MGIKNHNPGAIIETFNELKEMVSNESMKEQPHWAKEDLLKLKKVVDKNKDAIDQIEEVLFQYQLLLVAANPVIYVARTRDIKTDIEYFTAKTVYRLRNGKKREVKIHLGKASDYNNDTQSKRAKEDALVKMRQTIARRIREGSL